VIDEQRFRVICHALEYVISKPPVPPLGVGDRLHSPDLVDVCCWRCLTDRRQA